MELYEEILRRLVVPQDIALRLAENICYTSLAEIREIISNEALSDPECFCKIEEIGAAGHILRRTPRLRLNMSAKKTATGGLFAYL